MLNQTIILEKLRSNKVTLARKKNYVLTMHTTYHQASDTCSTVFTVRQIKPAVSEPKVVTKFFKNALDTFNTLTND
jgi:hypothetical protein